MITKRELKQLELGAASQTLQIVFRKIMEDPEVIDVSWSEIDADLLKAEQTLHAVTSKLTKSQLRELLEDTEVISKS